MRLKEISAIVILTLVLILTNKNSKDEGLISSNNPTSTNKIVNDQEKNSKRTLASTSSKVSNTGQIKNIESAKVKLPNTPEYVSEEAEIAYINNRPQDQTNTSVGYTALNSESVKSSPSKSTGTYDSNSFDSSPSYDNTTKQEENENDSGTVSFYNQVSTMAQSEDTETKASSSSSSSSKSKSNPYIPPTPRLQGLVPPLNGVITHTTFFTRQFSAYAATTCTDPKVAIFDTVTMSILEDNPIDLETISTSTQFEFNISELELDLTAPARYKIKLLGCDIELEKIVTSFYKNQNITAATTILAQLPATSINYSTDASFTKKLEAAEEALANTLADNLTNLEDAYTQIESDTEIQSTFNELTEGENLDILKSSKPKIKSILYATLMDEGLSSEFSALAEHWDSTYQIAYEWFVDGVSSGTGNVWNYTPPSNTLPKAIITLKVGKKQSDNDRVDTTLPFHEKSYEIDINQVNDAPTLTTPQTINTTEDSGLDFSLTEGVDPDSFSLTYSIVSRPTNGTLTCDPGTTSCTYTPNLNFTGIDSFTYKANDSELDSNIATVNINVANVNDRPTIAANEIFTATEDTALNFTLSDSTDIDNSSAQLSYKLITPPSNGILSNCFTTGSYTADLTCTYTPNADFNGSDTFTYIVNDGQYDSVGQATVTINTTPVNDAPTLSSTQSLATAEDTLVAFTLNTGSDIDADTLTYSIVSTTSNGVLTCTGGISRDCQYMPASNFNGVDSFTYKVNDGNLDSNIATATITISSENDAPLIGNDQTISTNEDTLVSFTLNNATDIDMPTQTLQYKLITGPTNGTLSNCLTTGSYTTDITCDYTPNLNFNGTDTFTYRANDTLVDSPTEATVTINITAVNDAPVLVATQSVLTNEDTLINFDLNAATDIENDALTYTIVSTTASGSLVCDQGSSRSCTYTPSTNFNGQTTFTYKASDATADSNTATVTIDVNSINDAPVMAANQSYSTDDNTPLSITLSNATDVDGDSLTYKIVSLPTNGVLSDCITTGSYGTDLTCTYTSNVNFNGTDSFTFIANDSTTDALSTATVSITVSDKTPSAPPSIALSSALYTSSTSNNLTVSSCSDINFVLINEGTQPTEADSAWQSCTTTASAITYTLANTNQGLHTLKAWSKDVNGNVSTTSTDISVFYDTQAPAISIATIANQAGSNSVTLSWDVTEDNISAAQTHTIDYWNGSNWVNITSSLNASVGPLTNTTFTQAWSVPNLNIEDAKVRVSLSDLAGNTNTVESNIFWIDSTAPQIAHDSFTSYGQNSTKTFTWTLTEKHIDSVANNFSLRFYDGSAWQNLTAVTAVTSENISKSYSADINLGPEVNNAIFEVSFTDAAGHSTTVQKNFVIDGSAPTVSSISLNGGATTTGNNNIQVDLVATDTASDITYICLKYDDTTAPSSINDECFTTLPEAKRAQNITITSADNLYVRIGFVTNSYSVYAWAADAAGNISTNTQVVGVDTDSINYLPGTPPEIFNIIATNTNTPSSPASLSQLQAPKDSDIYVKWKAIDNEGLATNPISIYYSYLDGTEEKYQLLMDNIANIQGSGCTITAQETGCIRLTGLSPTDAVYKIRVVALDSDGSETFMTSAPLNESNFRIIAGSTEKGIGGSGRSVIFKDGNSTYEIDLFSTVVTDRGDIFYRDIDAGLLWVDPATGIIKELLPTTGTPSGDGGSIENATIGFASAITLDYNNGLLIVDKGSIRRIDMNTTPWQISTLVGGGSNSNPGTSFAPSAIDIASFHRFLGTLVPLPNGDLYFRSTSSNTDRNWFHFDASENIVNRIQIDGVGIYNEDTYSWSGKSVTNMAIAYNAVNSALEHMHVSVHKPVTGNTHYRVARLDYASGTPTTTYNATAPYDIYTGYRSIYKTGLDGKIYFDYNHGRNLMLYDHVTNTYTRVLGTDSTSSTPCADGTAATSCPIDLQGYFVNQQGKIYFNDHGLIRTLDDSGNIVTLAGQFSSSGDGESALSARISASWQIDWGKDNGLDNTIVVGDYVSGTYREFTIGGTIETIVGGYSARSYSFSVDRTTGDIFDDVGSGVNRYSRTTLTNTRVIGSGATWYFDAASDGLVGTDIKFDWYNEQILGVANGELMLHKSRYNGSTTSDAFIKLYDMNDSYRQSHFAGMPDTERGNFYSAATPLASSRVPTYGGMVNSHYDSTLGWMFKQTSSARVMIKGGDGNIVDYTMLPRTTNGFTHVRYNSKEYYYYCASNKMWQYNFTDDIETELSWDAQVDCYTSQRKILYNPTNHSVHFLVVQNGLFAVAEYFL
ncbi:tandem-95 repeat protein [Halobacteriovorax sp. RT-1-4]|uniref:tandem-95 repeat protein n=1 Tax=unclassified Halobacteriovorax TaxID=2639665 RepID=UPI0039995C74